MIGRRFYALRPWLVRASSHRRRSASTCAMPTVPTLPPPYRSVARTDGLAEVAMFGCGRLENLIHPVVRRRAVLPVAMLRPLSPCPHRPPSRSFAPSQQLRRRMSTATPKTESIDESTRDVAVASTASLVQPGQALESSRDAGFDLAAAIGEPVDNSIQAKATIVRIRTDIVDAKTGEPRSLESKGAKRIDAVAIADDGDGIPEDILANVLSLGYGTRLNNRDGLGRFGMGLKLAALSQARRLDVWTKSAASDRVFHAYLDLDEVITGEQVEIAAREVAELPSAYASLMTNPRKKTPFTSGTLIVWSKVDRLEEGGRFGTALKERLQELTKYLARTFRQFIDKGLYLELNGSEVTLHDPLFLLDNPRVVKRFGPLKATVLADDPIEIDGHEVRVSVTLLPEAFRLERGKGGRGDEFRDLQIPDNHHRVSIMRQGREIFYDSLHHSFFPSDDKGGKEPLDRFIGVEVSFPAALDEYFRVRNVKKGAEPDTKLREEIRKLIVRPFEAARKEIRSRWAQTEAEQSKDEPPHEEAERAVARAEEHTPPGQAGRDLPEKRQRQVVDELVADLDLEEGEEGENREEAVRAAVETKPISLIDHDWPGKELLDITHLNGRAVVKINRRHPFIREIYLPLKELADKDPSQVAADDVLELARKVDVALDILFMAYAKAENMDAEADVKYADLRTYWGQFTAAYIVEALRG
jgi:hypothetical protein